MGCCQSRRTEDNQNAKYKLIEASKQMRKTTTGKSLNRKALNVMMTKNDFENIVRKSRSTATIFRGKYTEFSRILENLFLTGFGGITHQNLTDNQIDCIVNTTFEAPVYEIQGIESIRIPVDDDPNENILIYFDEVSLQIHEWIADNKRIVVHCLCGVSRSVTIILAYLMKYKAMKLKESYLFVKAKRPFVRPNNSFFEQLVVYEKSLYQLNTIRMIPFVNKKGVVFKIPDLYVKIFPKVGEEEERILDSTFGSLFTEI